MRDYITKLLSRTVEFRLARKGWVRHSNPVTLTYSVTAGCQSLCKTCQIGKAYRDNPKRAEEDLTLDEIEKIFRSVGHVYFFNSSGGEPFLRKDLPQIVELALKYLRSDIVHIPTNALAPERIRNHTIKILEIMEKHAPRVPLTIKPSIDGVGEKHDEIRGVQGNFKQLEKTIGYLKEIEKEYSNLHVELGTVISYFNIDHLSEIEDYVHSLDIQSYRNEIAEQRSEFFNLQDPITPDADTYEKLISQFKSRILDNLGNKRELTKIAESFRLVYYDLVIRILREKRQVIPCYGGISNVHINYDGEVWPCCVLGYQKPMGYLREQDYNFQKVWHSNRANAVRNYIRDGNCACPLANQAYSNILCHFPSLLKVGKNIFTNTIGYRRRHRGGFQSHLF